MPQPHHDRGTPRPDGAEAVWKSAGCRQSTPQQTRPGALWQWRDWAESSCTRVSPPLALLG